MADDRPGSTDVQGTGVRSAGLRRTGVAGTGVQGTAAAEPVSQGPVGGERPVQAPPKKKRGRETASDMIRSLGLVMVLVVITWFLAQPPDSDEQEIRVVDPAADVTAFASEAPAVPVPGGLPEQWRPTSSQLLRDPSGLRVGYVTPSGSYAEYATSTASRNEYLPEITGAGSTRLDPVEVSGVEWEQFQDGDGSLSLVRSYGPALVVVGTLRATAPLDELETLVEALETR